MIRLGEPGTALAGQLEQPVVEIETGPLTHLFEPAPGLIADGFEINRTANDVMPTAALRLNVAENYEIVPDGTSRLKDWQVRGLAGLALNAHDYVMGAKRIRIRTLRGNPLDDWLLFEGFAQKLELGWSGSQTASGRWATAFLVGTYAAADLEPSQFMWGQWRRTRAAFLEGLSEDLGRECCRVGVPLVFNPGGRANCDPDPLEFDDGTKVYIFTDPDNARAVPWTVAKMLRYIQWAAVEPAPPYSLQADRYDVLYNSLDHGLTDPGVMWTSYGLQHANLDEILAADLEGSVTLLESAPNNADGGAGIAALLRAYPDIAMEGFSVAECFAFLADRAGMLIDSWSEFDLAGQSVTKVKFAVRGHRWADEDVEGPPDAPGSMTRGVYLYIPADRRQEDPAEFPTEAKLLAEGCATEGRIMLDDSSVRGSVVVLGETAQHEMTVELKPGWTPDAWWDINHDDDDEVEAAIERLDTDEWANRYVTSTPSSTNMQYRHVGRLWVLNEDGAFRAAACQRTYGPWSSSEAWEPYDFRNVAGVNELTFRGDAGWSVRRRRFLPTRATNADAPDSVDAADEFGIMVEISFDGGSSWMRYVVNVTNEPTRCAITFPEADLRAFEDGDGESFATAYLRGNLRVRVTANVESDDRMYGFEPPPEDGAPVVFAELLDRQERLARRLRGSADSALWAAYNFHYPGSRDDQQEADAIARRVLAELRDRRSPGQVTIPFLLRDDDTAPWPNYRIGDEILGVRTGDADTSFLVGGSWNDQVGRAPRITAINYRYSRSPAEVATILQIDDEIYSDVQEGSPGYA